MAKGSRGKTSVTRGVNISTANHTRLRLPPRLPSSRLLLYEDRRQFHPEGVYARPATFDGSRQRIGVSSSPNVNKRKGRSRPFFKPILAFEHPLRVVLCARRKIRKEVLHALGKSGRGGQRKPRYSYYSSISCKG